MESSVTAAMANDPLRIKPIKGSSRFAELAATTQTNIPNQQTARIQVDVVNSNRNTSGLMPPGNQLDTTNAFGNLMCNRMTPNQVSIAANIEIIQARPSLDLERVRINMAKLVASKIAKGRILSIYTWLTKTRIKRFAF